jgi:hypothetical protein
MSDLTVADIVVLLSELDRLRTVAESRLMRMRSASRLLTAEIGAKGPENVDITAGRAVAVIEALRDELTAARRAPGVEWQESIDGWMAKPGAFMLHVDVLRGWRLSIETEDGPYERVDSGPETGPAGKSAAEAAYRRAAGLD